MSRFDKSYKKEIVELASAGAVLLGLIFVGLELKQNTEAVQAATLQGITDATQDYLLLMFVAYVESCWDDKHDGNG